MLCTSILSCFLLITINVCVCACARVLACARVCQYCDWLERIGALKVKVM